jgi:hypothetical protein
MAVAPGSATVAITASDPGGLTATASVSVMVPNRAPRAVETIDSLTVPVGEQGSVDVSGTFTEPDGETLSYSASSSNPEIATASVSGSAVTVTAVARGMATVTVTATDPGGASATHSFDVTVPNRAPESVGSIPAQTVTEGDTEWVPLRSYFRDPDGDALAYTAAIADPQVADVAVADDALTIRALATGVATITVTATDPGGLTATQTVTVEVTPGNRAPQPQGTISAQSVAVGGTATVNLSPYFTDPDGDALTYAATSDDRTVATVSVSGTVATVTGMEGGTATMTVTARDPGGLSVTQTMGVTVEAVNLPPNVVGGIHNQAVTVGDAIAEDVAEFFEDPEGDPLTFGATSADNAVATASVDGSMLTVVAVAEGTTTVEVTATDTEGTSNAFQFEVTVGAPNRRPVIADVIPDQTMMVGDKVRLDPADYFGDPDGDELSYHAVSSNTEVVTALIDANGIVEIAAHAASSAALTVTATDPLGLEAAQQVMVMVTVPAPVLADTIPTHDMIVDSMVPLDVSRYFAGYDPVYTATSSDEMVAVASVDGSVVTTMGVGAVEDGISTAMLMVTATNAGGSAVQDSIMVRVHLAQYDVLPGLTVTEDGDLAAQVGTTTLTLSGCLLLQSFPVPGVGTFTVFWSEWQRAVGGGWITAQNNVFTDPILGDVNICPIMLEQEQYPPGIYRLVGHVQIGDDTGFYRTPTIEKKPEGI